MSFHPEILKPRQHEVLRSLGAAATRHGFYLGGGTAIALHLGHRRSVDFDWFRQPLLEDPLELARELQEEGIPFVTGWTRRSTLYGTVRGVRVSYFQFRYRLLRPLRPWSEAGCQLAALEDLACMKLSAISQRGSRKDFVDLFALGRHGFSLQQMLGWYREKFEVDDIAHLLYAPRLLRRRRRRAQALDDLEGELARDQRSAPGLGQDDRSVRRSLRNHSRASS